MIDPQECLARVLQDGNPDDLYDLLIWVRAAEGAQRNAELNILLRDLFGKTQASIDHQSRYDKRRLSQTAQTKTQNIDSKFPA